MSKVRWGVLGTANIARWGMIPGMKQAEDRISRDIFRICILKGQSTEYCRHKATISLIKHSRPDRGVMFLWPHFGHR